MVHLLCLVWWWERDPLSASFPLITEFLTYLFQDYQLAPSTIAGYRAAIASAFKYMGLPDVGHNPALTAFLASFSRERPRRQRVLPQWDLALVLMTLTRAPFQPLQLAASKFLAWKTFFLTLLTSGARRSKLHTITAKGVQHNEKWKSVSLFPHPGFISKTQLCTKGAQSLLKLHIPALLPRLGPDMTEDHSLFPVRALKIYLARTDDKPKNRELLLVSYKEGHKGDLHKNTLSG